jgi:hypothetical protein
MSPRRHGGRERAIGAHARLITSAIACLAIGVAVPAEGLYDDLAENDLRSFEKRARLIGLDYQSTPLVARYLLACEAPQAETLDFLFERGADPNLAPRATGISYEQDHSIDFEAPLAIALERGLPGAIVSRLLAAGADANRPNRESEAPLPYALEKGARIEILASLLDAGAKADVGLRHEPDYWPDALRRDRFDGFPLVFLALRRNDASIMRLLLGAGMSPEPAVVRGKYDWDSYTILDAALESGWYRSTAALLGTAKGSLEIPDTTKSRIEFAIAVDDEAGLKKALAGFSGDSRALLKASIDAGSEKCFALLYAFHEDDPRISPKYGEFLSPLEYAAAENPGFVDVMRAIMGPGPGLARPTSP